MHKIKEFIFKEILFFVLVIFLLGTIFGLYVGYNIYSYKIEENIKMGGFVYNNKIYHVSERR